MPETPEILLVEDNNINQLVARQILKSAGFTCDTCADGNSALEQLRSRHYRLVLMDVQMPGLDGIEATKQIRSSEDQILNRDVPIIAMTAYTTPEDRELCRNAGMNDYISKPLQLDEFVAKVKAHLQSPDKAGSTEEDVETGGPASGRRQNPAPLKAFDLDDALRRTSGDEEMLTIALQRFFSTADNRLAELTEGLRSGAHDSSQRIAHNLAGAASNVSALRLHTSLKKVDVACRAGRIEEAREESENLPALLTAFRKAVDLSGYASNTGPE